MISGFDQYVAGQGQMRWRLLRLLPMVQAQGPDLSRSAAGRVVGEAIWLPTALLPRLGAVFQRWGDPDNTGAYGLHPFGGEVTAYATFGGVSIPGAGCAGWCYGTDRWPQGEFFRYQLTSMEPPTPRPA
jgi:hypothetical protein